MQDTLLKHLLESSPHINTKVATDWVQSIIIETRQNIEKRGEKLTPKKLDEKVEKTIKWHIKRINGFGGSDMSVLYTEYLGGFYPFGTKARDVVGQKLCLVTPGFSNGDTERGNGTEMEARMRFEFKMRHLDLEPYDEAYRALDELNKKGGVPNHPWMNSSPDGIYISKKTGKVILVDFKTPADADLCDEMKNNPPDYYRAQLAQYKYNLEAAGIKVDIVMLAPFSTKKWDVEIGQFSIPQKLTDDILAAGDFYWNCVLSNELPLGPRGENYEYIAEMPKGFQEVVAKFILIKKMMSIIKKLDDDNKSKLLRFASFSGIDWDHTDKKTGIGGINISCKEKNSVDSKALADARQGALEDFELEVKKYDSLIRNLVSAGQLTSENMPEVPKLREINEDDFLISSSQVTVSVARGKKHPNASFVQEMETIGERAINFAEEDMMNSNNFEITLDEIKQLISDPTSPFYKNDEAMQLFSEIGFKIIDESPVSNKKELPNDMDVAF